MLVGVGGHFWLTVTFCGLCFPFNLHKQLDLFIFVTRQLGEGLHQGRGWPCRSREHGFPKTAWQMTHCIDLLSAEVLAKLCP